jgi:hypothetical protein
VFAKFTVVIGSRAYHVSYWAGDFGAYRILPEMDNLGITRCTPGVPITVLFLIRQENTKY